MKSELVNKEIDEFCKNPLLEPLNVSRRQEVLKAFTKFSGCTHENYLSLHKYIAKAPYKFYSKRAFSLFLDWLENTDTVLDSYLNTHSNDLDHAFIHLEEINQLTWHDSIKITNDYEIIRFIDQQIHPAYLRLTESVLTPFCRIIAHFSRLNRQKDTSGLDIWNISEELKIAKLSELMNAYKPVMRNGISHGGVVYLQSEVLYKDKKGKEERFLLYEIVRIYDELLDIW